MSALSNPMLWQHEAGRLWVLGGTIVKIMTAVSNASKGRCEQWVRMKKQIKTAGEKDNSIQVSMCLEESVAISIKVKNIPPGTSLVAQWLRICLPMQGTRVRSLVREDPTCRGATKPLCHNY